MRLPAVLSAFLLLAPPTARAQEERRSAPRPAEAPVRAGEAAARPISAERSATTRHELSLGGQALAYTATAGTLHIQNDQGEPDASVFYVAYTLDGVKDPARRPVTFLYNGGPGSASLWLHMGSVGPVRVTTASPAATGPAPYHVVPNEYSLLDRSDLVFIDAVGAGYSRPVGKGTDKDFAGVDQDASAFARFITRWVSVNRRWSSPKYLLGESYGTLRSAALAAVLENGGMSLNGIVLVSSILNYGVHQPGLDIGAIGTLPTYAAIAWQHGRVAGKPGDLKAFLEEVRAFARGPYADALMQGQNLPEAQREAIADRLSRYTGLSKAYWVSANLRVDQGRFRKELLRDQRLVLGRYDGRFEGTDVDAAGEVPGNDPSSSGINGAFIASLNDYLARELNFTSTDPYLPSARGMNQLWDWKHRVGGGGGSPMGAPGRAQNQPWVGADLADAMRKNPRLQVLSLNGYYDLATPFFLTELDLAHLYLEPALRGNLRFAYYPSGHMIYLDLGCLKQMKADLAAFYDATR